MPRDSERARRLAIRRAAKGLLEPLRGLVRDLAEVERLEALDAIGVVRIEAGEPEAHYAADLLDLVAQAVGESGQNRVVEVFVISSATDSIHRAQPIGGNDDGKQRQRVRRGRSRSGA